MTKKSNESTADKVNEDQKSTSESETVKAILDTVTEKKDAALTDSAQTSSLTDVLKTRH
jgi:hypothetical protein